MTSPLLAPPDEYVIERPRLLDALDGAETRIRMLIAPAGYGKTTLLRQWLAHNGAPYAWYAVGPEGPDVAAVAAKIAEAVGGVLPGAGLRMLGRLGVSNDPEAEAAIFADILAEELPLWPEGALLAIDDYQELAVSSACERFVGRLLRQAPIPLVLTSRRRPRWARARSLLYGESFLLGRHELAMTPAESRQVLALGEWTDCDRLIELGAGWPAIIALAARSQQHPLPGGVLPPALYAYFAEELFQTLPAERRTLLCQLAATPRLSPSIVDAISARDDGCDLLAETEQLGFVGPHEQPDELVFHPLLRTFLEDKLNHHPDCRQLVTEMARVLVEQRRWDDAWELVRRFDRADLLAELVEAALATALQGRRVPTLADWVALARERDVTSPVIDLADAELSFLAGECARAQALAEQAASVLAPGSDLAAAALIAAGRAAHFRCHYSAASSCFRHGHEVASSQEARIDALWGQFTCAIECEDPEWKHLLRTIAQCPLGTPDSAARVAMGHIFSSHYGGNPAEALHEWGHTMTLVTNVRDPRIRTSFLYQAAHAALVAAEYREASTLANRLVSELEENRMRFSLPHAYLVRAGAELGLRHFRHCETLIQRALELGRRDEWVTARAVALETVLSLARHAYHEPRIILNRTLPPAVRAHQLALLALVRGCGGDTEAAARLANEAEVLTSNVEAQALARFARLLPLSDATTHESELLAAFDFVASRGVWDVFVCCYRADPALLRALLARRECVPLIEAVLGRAHDERLALQLGVTHHVQSRSDDLVMLSPREHEVLSLVADGLSNRDIAQRLFISTVTVKVHLRHIFDKLGVQNRTEAALKAVESE
jgi:ATP/maltotriose-dependent transcriptional regulator MalT